MSPCDFAPRIRTRSSAVVKDPALIASDLIAVEYFLQSVGETGSGLWARVRAHAAKPMTRIDLNCALFCCSCCLVTSPGGRG